jgi:hypothetical protein
VLADKIDAAPTAISLLDVRERKRGDFRPAQAAAQENSDDSPVAETPDGGDVGCVEQALRLPRR